MEEAKRPLPRFSFIFLLIDFLFAWFLITSQKAQISLLNFYP